MNSRFQSFVLVSAIISLTACATVRPMKPTVDSPVQLIEKNYKIGEKQDVYVGDELLKVKDYWAKKITLSKMEAQNNFEITTGLLTSKGSKGDRFLIYGITQNNGEDVYLLEIPGLYFNVGVTKNGRWADYLVSSEGQIGICYRKIVPEDTRFEFMKDIQIDTTHGFTNFEILFNGVTKDSISLLYREYTSENMARPAFYQNLTYPIDTEVIRFKNIKIKVNEISNERITYTVLEDSLPGESIDPNRLR